MESEKVCSPKVYISILNWNGLDDTIECLESIFKLDYDNCHLVVVDNNSSDNSVSVLRERYPTIHIIENKMNTGFTGGNNIAIQYAINNGADYVWLLNNDTVVEAKVLTSLVHCAEHDKSIGMVSPILYFYDSPDTVQFQGSYIVDSSLKMAHVKDKLQLSQAGIKERMILWGTALLIKREVITTVGFLDDKLFAYAEDIDLSIRVNKAGYYNTLCWDAKVFHKDSKSTGGVSSPIQFFLRTRNIYFLKMKYLPFADKIPFLRNYVADAIENSTDFLTRGQTQLLEANLNGVWCAFNSCGGSFADSKPMPKFVRKLVIMFSTWHPYFWSTVIRGKYGELAREVKSRVFNLKLR